MDSLIVGTTANAISSGGTINGSITIEGDLTVNGDGSGNYDEIVDGNLAISSTNKLVLGGDGSDTYLQESGADVLDIYVGGANMIKLTESSTDTMTVTGALTIGSDGSGHDVTFYSDTAGDSFVWDSSAEKLTITGTNGQTALDIADGNLVVADNIDLEGDIDVNGTANLDVVDIDGAVDMASTLTVAGIIDVAEYLKHTGDTDTHIRFSANDAIEITAGNVKMMRFLEDDSQDMVVINEDSADIDFRVESNNNANMFFVDGGNDKVSIGIGSSDGTLHVHSASAGSVSANANADDLVVENSGIGGISILTPDANSARLYFGSASDNDYGRIIGNYNSGSPYLTLRTSVADTLVITSGGQVAIGTTTASNVLHIEADSGDEGLTVHSAGDTANAVILDANRSGAGSALGNFVGKWNGTTVGYMGFFSGADTTNKDDATIRFATASAGSATERMRITSAGDVGIGTSSPSGQLHISGSDDTDQIIIENTDADNDNAPDLVLYRKSSSPADSDELGHIEWRGRNDNSQDVSYAQIRTVARDVSDGTEDSRMIQYIMQNGTAVIGFKSDDAEFAINESSVDMDFRVESNGNANMLFVDGGNDVIGIGTNSPDTGHLLTLKTSGTGGDWIKGEQSDGGQGWRIGADSGDDAFFELQKADASQTILLSADGDSHFSGGNVGIGTTSPDQLLHVKATSGNVYGKIEATGSNQAAGLYLIGHSGDESRLYFGDEGSSNIGRVVYAHGDNSMQFTTNSSEAMRITSGGKVGIGESSPSGKLHITDGDGQVSTGVYITNERNANNNNFIRFRKARQPTDSTHEIITSGDYLGQIDFQGCSADNTYRNGATIYAITEGTISGSQIPTNLQFHTVNTSGTDAERMRISADGKVGIGENSPDTTLHVTSTNPYLTLENSSTEDNDTGRESQVRFQGRQSGGEVSVLAKIQGSHDGSSDDQKGDMIFYTNNGSGEQEAFRIDSSQTVTFAAETVFEGNMNVAQDIFHNGDNDTTIRFTSDQFAFITGNATRMVIDNNTRISLSNNDGGSTSGVDSTTGNTIFGYLAGAAVDSDVINNTIFGHKAGNALNAGDGNVIIGSQAGDALTTGLNNTFVGREAGSTTTDVDLAVVVGYGAGNADMTADANGTVCIGSVSGNAITSGIGNTAVGYYALAVENDGDHSTAIGYQSLTAQTGTTGTVQNTAVGFKSGLSINTGAQNTIVGTYAGDALTDATANVAVGVDALGSSVSGSQIVAIGHSAVGGANVTTGANGTVGIGKDALVQLTSGSGNVAVGYHALDAVVGGSHNTAVGYDALTTAAGNASHNTAVGRDALKTWNVDGDGNNTAVGSEAGAALTTGVSNVLIGAEAGKAAQDVDGLVLVGDNAGKTLNNSNADNTIAVGRDALVALTSGNSNIAVGAYTLDAMTVGDNNTAIGTHAGTAIDSSDGNDDNTFVGATAGMNATDASQTTAVGYGAGRWYGGGTSNNATGAMADCTLIGSQASASSNTPTNQIVIGEQATGQGDNYAVIGNSSIERVYMAQDSGATVYCSGINFPDTQAASGDANTLDDYEEGVHAVTLGGASFTMSSVKNSLQYTKIGRLVTLSGEISVTAVSSATGTFTISLPFTVADIDDLAERFQGTFSCQNINFSGDYLNIGSYAGQNTMSVQISNSNGAWTYLQASTFSSTSEFVVSVQYIT